MMSRDPKKSPSGKLIQIPTDAHVTMHIWIQIATDATQEKINLKVKVLVAWHLHPVKMIQPTK